MSLRPKLLWDSTVAVAPAAEALVEPVDVATDAAGAALLARLGLARADLPVLLVSDAIGKLRVLGARLTPEEIAALADGRGVPTSALTVYGASWCPDCRIAKRVLAEAGAKYDEIDIDQDASAEAAVIARSGGRRVIPTLAFDGRIWAFNPQPPQLRRLLQVSGSAP
ncbi:MAG TPA: glutaredoxin family protein [Thermoanaerobaculia bacterium]|nr:glutaredoxin family protein [Thermoanaerobaculia bacterium]